jgi:hypothetical protein
MINNFDVLSLHRAGSIIAGIKMSFNFTTGENPWTPLRNAVAKGEIDGMPINGKQTSVGEYLFVSQLQKSEFLKTVTLLSC